ncbi:unnamed protein product [Anisakis simplex]|uniref:E3 ubiquitin-protein ligase listerin n=1 Tax=Anisakis simplex TaxID=6269 RepID=A0A0M3J9J5_ANISI|nr:unnamed protein product [Anisakis simplex]
MSSVIVNSIIPICMEVVELGVELVFNTSDLLSAIIDSVDAKWRENVLVKKYFVSDIVEMLRNLTTHPDDEKLTQSLSTRLHLSCLLWDSIADEYLSESTKCSLESMLISILEFIASKQSHALMKLIAPVCLWFDLYSKMLTMKSNKTKMQNIV